MICLSPLFHEPRQSDRHQPWKDRPQGIPEQTMFYKPFTLLDSALLERLNVRCHNWRNGAMSNLRCKPIRLEETALYYMMAVLTGSYYLGRMKIACRPV